MNEGHHKMVRLSQTTVIFFKCCGHPATSPKLLEWPQDTTVICVHRPQCLTSHKEAIHEWRPPQDGQSVTNQTYIFQILWPPRDLTKLIGVVTGCHSSLSP